MKTESQRRASYPFFGENVRRFFKSGEVKKVRLRVILLLVLAAAAVFSASSCGNRKNTGQLSTSLPASSAAAASVRNSTMKSAATVADSASPPVSVFPIDVREEAKKLGSTPGQVALAAIISRLDNASPVEDLSRNSAKELFDDLRQTASQKSQTLEALDQLYDLSDILASEGIYVRFQANNIVSSAPSSASDGWIDGFQKAINAAPTLSTSS